MGYPIKQSSMKCSRCALTHLASLGAAHALRACHSRYALGWLVARTSQVTLECSVSHRVRFTRGYSFIRNTQPVPWVGAGGFKKIK